MIRVAYQANLKRSVAYDGIEEIGECTYKEQADKWVIDHTFVDSSYQGQGVAKQLVENLVEEARKSGVGLGATCSYAMALFDKTSDYDDVVVKF